MKPNGAQKVTVREAPRTCGNAPAGMPWWVGFLTEHPDTSVGCIRAHSWFDARAFFEAKTGMARGQVDAKLLPPEFPHA